MFSEAVEVQFPRFLLYVWDPFALYIKDRAQFLLCSFEIADTEKCGMVDKEKEEREMNELDALNDDDDL